MLYAPPRVFYILTLHLLARGAPRLAKNYLFPREATENQQLLKLFFGIHDAALKLRGLVNICFTIFAFSPPLTAIVPRLQVNR